MAMSLPLDFARPALLDKSQRKQRFREGHVKHVRFSPASQAKVCENRYGTGYSP